MLNSEKIQVPFMEDTYLTKLQSLKDPERFLFASSDVLKLTTNINFTQLRKNAQLVQGKDYVVLEKKSQSVELWDELKNLKLFSKGTARITMVYESGFWKILMSSIKTGGKMIDWIASDVLPDIARTGSYNFKKIRSQEPYKTYLVKDTFTGYYKIGKTMNVENRINGLSNSNINLKLIDIIDRDVEKKLHKTFDYYRIQKNREWFDFKEDFDSFYYIFKELKDKTDDYLPDEESISQVLEEDNHSFENCLQVTGQTPSELKKAYGRPNKSSKEILREYDPAKAMTMSLNDHLVEKEKMELNNLVVLDDLLTKTFQEMLNIGIKLIP